jgi:two-component system, NarL family, sensor kinase
MKTKILYCFLVLRVFWLPAQATEDLETKLNSKIADTTRLKILTDLRWNYTGIDLVKAKAFAEQEIALAQRINNHKYIAQGYNDLGIIAIRKSNYKEALTLHKKALTIRLPLGNDIDVASSYSKIGVCSYELADYMGAYRAALKALEIYERLDNKIYIAYTLNTMCAVSVKLEQYDKVMEYAQRAHKYAMESEDKGAQGAALNYLAAAFQGQGNINEAVKKQEAAYRVFESMPDSNYMASALCNLGYFHRLLYKDQEAVAYYKKALEIVEVTNDINSVALYNHNLASLYIDLKQYAEGKKHLETAERTAKGQSMNDVLMLVYRVYAELSIRTGKEEEAIEYIQKFAAIKDSIFSRETAKQFSEMKVKYETEKKETQNILLKNENDLKTAQLSRGKLLQVFMGSVIVTIIVISCLLFGRARLKQKQTLSAELLKQQELRSKAVIEAEEKERIRIARELHDGIGQQLSAAKLNISGLQGAIKSTDPTEITMLQNAIDLLDESVKEVRAVSHNMIPNALIKSGLVSAVREFIHRISSTGNLKVNLEIIGLKSRLETIVENILFRVLQELVNNIIKHAKATEVSIQFIRHEKELAIVIEDNGIGFDVEKQLGNVNEGIGLKNIESRVSFLKGEVIFDSYPGKGTTVTIEIPL